MLPVTAWYERTDHKWVTPLMPFIHGGEKVAPAFHEAKSDWEIAALLAKKIQERAAARGVTPFKDRRGEERRLDRTLRRVQLRRRPTEQPTTTRSRAT